MRKCLLFIVFACIGLLPASQPVVNWGVQFSDAIISRYQPTINTMTSKGWEYSNSVVLHGMEKLYLQTQDTRYLNYIKAYVDTYVNNNGTVSGLGTALDRIQPAILCLFLYQETGLTKYKTAATNVRNYLLGAASQFHKTPDGGYWHKNDGNYNNIMMVDGIYMAHPFLAKYGAMFNDAVAIDAAVFQALLLASHVYDGTAHLAKHAWDYSKIRPWANAVTGASGEVWSRGMGWYAMAIVDILRYLPATHPQYNNMRTLLTELVAGIKNTQDSSSGLWYQVMNKQDSAGNYLEASGSGMFVYALKTAVNNKWIDSSYIPVAEKGWTGLQTKFFTYTDGMPGIGSFAPAMSVQNNYKAYTDSLPVNCPAPFPAKQHPHGYCAVLMAASVMETAQRILCPGANTFFTSGYKGSYNWQWQKNEGNGYADLSDDLTYNGTHSDTLRVTSTITSLYGTRYRCVIQNATDTICTNEYVLKFSSNWLGAAGTAWENAANWSCGSVPDANTDVVIKPGAPSFPEVNTSTFCRSIKLSSTTAVNVKPGVILTLKGN